MVHSACPHLARCTERSGGHGEAFVLHDEVIGPTGDEALLLQSAGEAAPGMACAGKTARDKLFFNQHLATCSSLRTLLPASIKKADVI
jgi:hypothetical protein